MRALLNTIAARVRRVLVPEFGWWISLLLYSLFVPFSPYGIQSVVAIPFYTVVPGYALSTSLFSEVGRLNKLGLSLLTSPALAIAFRSTIVILGGQDTVSEVEVMSLISAACFGERIVRILFSKASPNVAKLTSV